MTHHLLTSFEAAMWRIGMLQLTPTISRIWPEYILPLRVILGCLLTEWKLTDQVAAAFDFYTRYIELLAGTTREYSILFHIHLITYYLKALINCPLLEQILKGGAFCTGYLPAVSGGLRPAGGPE